MACQRRSARRPVPRPSRPFAAPQDAARPSEEPLEGGRRCLSVWTILCRAALYSNLNALTCARNSRAQAHDADLSVVVVGVTMGAGLRTMEVLPLAVHTVAGWACASLSVRGLCARVNGCALCARVTLLAGRMLRRATVLEAARARLCSRRPPSHVIVHGLEKKGVARASTRARARFVRLAGRRWQCASSSL